MTPQVQAMPELPEPAPMLYDPYRETRYSPDQMHAYAQAYAEALRVQLEAARAALKAICIGAPTETPEGYEGDNHGDTAHAAIQEEHFRLAQIARAALSNHTKEQSNG